MKVHCGYLFYLFVGLCAELAAGRVLPTDRTDTTDTDMQSIIEDLQAALKIYGNVLNETSYLRDVPVLPCTETPADLEESSTVVRQLSEYQVCAQKLQSFSPDVSALCRVVMLNKDLLQHLKGSYQDSAGCPSSSSSSSSSSPPSDFDTIRKSIQCVHCWSQQVAALSR